MSGMIVHGVPGSPYVRAALLTLEEKGAVYQLAAMALGTLKQQPHLSRHPFGRIPAFEHDGWMLYETRAIMRYIDAVVPGPRLQPEDPRAAARMDQLMNITDWYLMPQVSVPITRNRVVAPRVKLVPGRNAIFAGGLLRLPLRKSGKLGRKVSRASPELRALSITSRKPATKRMEAAELAERCRPVTSTPRKGVIRSPCRSTAPAWRSRTRSA